MKAKDLLLPLTLALITTWALQYFWGGTSKELTSPSNASGRYQAPTPSSGITKKNLMREVDFIDAKPQRKTELVTIDTDHGQYTFSNDGASLEQITYKQWEQKGPITTLTPAGQQEKEQKCFLVALDEKTPYYFDLVSQQEDEKSFTLIFKADFEDGVMVKTFTIAKDEYKIDLDITIEPKGSSLEKIQPRVFFSAPHLMQLGENDTVSAIAIDKNKFETFRPDAAIKSQWLRPSLFGLQDRYFVHSLVSDTNQFVQRGYYKMTTDQELQAILEGPEIDTKTSWTLSFYVGPKVDSTMAAVDDRLTKTISYGIFGFISKPLSKLMLNILNWLYKYVQNYGWAIIILTILMRLLMLPFTFKSQKAMKKQEEVSRKMQYVEQKYKHDKEALAQAKADIIKKHGMPAVGGCLPLLLQLPLFWALSIVLSNAFELYKAPFLWIPDLSARDPYYVLPILTFIFMALSGVSKKAQQQIGSIALALFISAIIANVSAGLALYIFVSTALGVAQTYIMRHA